MSGLCVWSGGFFDERETPRWWWAVPERRASLILAELAEADAGLTLDQLVDMIPPPRPKSIRQLLRTVLNFLEYSKTIRIEHTSGKPTFFLCDDAPEVVSYYGVPVPKWCPL